MISTISTFPGLVHQVQVTAWFNIFEPSLCFITTSYLLFDMVGCSQPLVNPCTTLDPPPTLGTGTRCRPSTRFYACEPSSTFQFDSKLEIVSLIGLSMISFEVIVAEPRRGAVPITWVARPQGLLYLFCVRNELDHLTS